MLERDAKPDKRYAYAYFDISRRSFYSASFVPIAHTKKISLIDTIFRR